MSNLMLNIEFIDRPSVIDWLLELNDSSVRYFALTELLDRPELDKDVQETKKNIMKSRLVSKIFSTQNGDRHGETPNRFYTAKYRLDQSVWTTPELIIWT